MPKKESNIQADVLSDLKSMKPYVYSIKVISSNKNGTADIIFCSMLTGMVVVEMKKESDFEVRKNQTKNMKDAYMAGAEAFICNSIDDWIKIKHFLELNTQSLKRAHIKSLKKFDPYIYRKVKI